MTDVELMELDRIARRDEERMARFKRELSWAVIFVMVFIASCSLHSVFESRHWAILLMSAAWMAGWSAMNYLDQAGR